MLKGLIFDVDGVLVDSMPLHADAWIETFRGVGIEVTRQDIYEIEGSNHVGVIEKMFKRNGRTPEASQFDELLAIKRGIFLSKNDIEMFPEMDRCLKLLKNTYRLAVASGADRTIVGKIIDRFFPDTFDAIISGEDVTKGKPSPEPYIKALEMLGLNKEECIVVENAPLGVESAKEAGLYCVAVPTYVTAEKLEKADLILEDHVALKKYLKDLVERE